MAKLRSLTPRKEPTQRRSIEMRNAILEAATYVLKKEGAFGFTTNKVADRAGANIASLYQYYPNKEALLFHLVENEWSATCDAVFPILTDETKSHRERLHLFIEKFYETEAEEGDLKEAIGAAGILIEDTKEYRELEAKAEEMFIKFLSGAMPDLSKSELKKNADFIHHVISSFSENKPEKEWSSVRSDAKIMSEMICSYFKIND